ncbi:hypothetical protein ACIGMX_34835 [Streptomyces aquilus]|uniref:hypothetical protein n=1 Tax=Streptomyces aquilus TaxID=2548456 RepID=UPI0037D2AE5D
MKYRRKSRTGDARNDRHFVVSYRPAGFPRDWEFNTSDERQATRKAAELVGKGFAVRLREHLGLGQYRDVDIPRTTS